MVGDIEDLSRVRRAQRAGAQPVQVHERDWTTHRAPSQATIAYETDGGVLELVRNGRVTRLGRLWDQERARSLVPQSHGTTPQGRGTARGPLAP
jgi:hypothetical protein